MDYIEEDYKKLALQFAKLFSDCTPAECKEALHNEPFCKLTFFS